MTGIMHKIKIWLYWDAPRIITSRGLFIKLVKYDAERSKIEKEFNWKVIRPIINDLEKLRANTWDQDKITWIQQYLRDNFEVNNNDKYC